MTAPEPASPKPRRGVGGRRKRSVALIWKINYWFFKFTSDNNSNSTDHQQRKNLTITSDVIPDPDLGSITINTSSAWIPASAGMTSNSIFINRHLRFPFALSMPVEALAKSNTNDTKKATP